MNEDIEEDTDTAKIQSSKGAVNNMVVPESFHDLLQEFEVNINKYILNIIMHILHRTVFKNTDVYFRWKLKSRLTT